MRKTDPAIETARITARQAIAVALITGIVSIVTTLIATGNLITQKIEGTASDSGSRTSNAPVLDAPHIFFSARSIEFPLSTCMEKARGALDRGEFTGIDSARYFSWGYRGENVGGIWCHTDVGQMIFLAAGKEQAAVEGTKTVLERSY